MSETVVTGASDEGFLEKKDADLIHEATLHSEDIRRLFTSKEYAATRAALVRLLSKSPFRQQEYAIDQVAKADPNNYDGTRKLDRSIR